MKIKDLIAELQRFDGDAYVAIEAQVTHAMTGQAHTETQELQSVEPFNDGRHSVKIVSI